MQEQQNKQNHRRIDPVGKLQRKDRQIARLFCGTRCDRQIRAPEKGAVMKNWIIAFAFGLSASPFLAQAGPRPFEKPVRAGFSLGAVGPGSAALSADVGPVISDNITLGGELYGLRLVSLRGLIWQMPESLSGFHGGPKLFLGLGSKLSLEPGGEFGWIHRFPNRIDAGLGADLVVGQYLGGALKICVGYLF